MLQTGHDNLKQYQNAHVEMLKLQNPFEETQHFVHLIFQVRMCRCNHAVRIINPNQQFN